MLCYDIPGRGRIEIENVVLDYNGTIAVDGKIIGGVKELLEKLKKHVKVYVLTADTYGIAINECKNLGVNIMTFPNEDSGFYKKEIVRKLGGRNTLCIGNGYNDIPMFKEAILSIAVIEGEGASSKLILNADIVTKSIIDAIKLILDENRMKATLRN
jgi:P-type E1-E2 ATPase